MNPQMLIAALDYGKRGWRVLPLHTPQDGGRSCKRQDCGAPGKHPRTRNGLADATTDARQIHAWWAQWPEANIGVLTGTESRLLVVDLDDKRDKRGVEAFHALAAASGFLPNTLCATTGNGVHLFFEHPGGQLRNSTSKLADGVDVRADGGYVVASPSLHANGVRYAWANEEPLARPPDWLISKIAEGNKSTAVKEKTIMKEDGDNGISGAQMIPQGQRNDSLYYVGCSLRGRQGMDQGQMTAVLLQYNDTHCIPPMDEQEVLAVVKSVCQHPAELAPKKAAKRLEQNPLYWYQLNTRDWFSDQDIMLMTDFQTGWYIILKTLAWNGGGFLTADRSKLWRLAKARSRAAFEKDCALVLSEYEEVIVDGELKLKHPQMAVRYVETLAIWMKKKDAGEASKLAYISSRQATPGIVPAASNQPGTVQ